MLNNLGGRVMAESVTVENIAACGAIITGVDLAGGVTSAIR